MGVIACGGAYAATTCLHNRTAVYVLKKSENGTTSSYNNDDFTWTVTFGYDIVPSRAGSGKLTGNATCNEIDTNSDDGTAKKGDANVHLRSSNADVGTRCWCSMAAPVSSWWVFLQSYDDDAACAAGCARDCAAAVKSNTDNFRSNGVYMAIW